MADVTRLARNARTELSTGSTAYGRLSRFLIPASTFPVSTSVTLRLLPPASQPDSPRAFVMPWPDLRHRSPSDSPYVRAICMSYNMVVARTYGCDSSRHACVIPSPRNFAAAMLNYARDLLVCNRCLGSFSYVVTWRNKGCEEQYRKREALYVFAHCALSVRDCLSASEISFRKLLALKSGDSKSFYNLYRLLA